MKYAVINDNGQILRTGNCAPGDLYLQGDNVVEVTGDISDEKHYFKNGKFEAYPTRPSNFHKFDYSNGRWFDNRSDQEKNKEVLRHVREERNRLLRESDWTQMADSPLTETERATWATYRQQLRDLPAKCSTITEISEIIFPTLEG